MLRHSSRQNGYSLLELVFAVAMSAIITVGIGSVFLLQAQSAAETDSKFGQLQLQTEIRNSIRSVAQCSKVFKAVKFSPTGPSDVSLTLNFGPTGKTTIASGANLREYKLWIRSLRLVNPRPTGIQQNGNPVYVADLRLQTGAALESGEAKRSLASLQTTKEAFRPVSLGQVYLEVGAGSVAGCFHPDDSSKITAMSCAQAGGTMANGICQVPTDLGRVACTGQELMQGFNSNGQADCKEPISEVVVSPPEIIEPTIVKCQGGVLVCKSCYRGKYALANEMAVKECPPGDYSPEIKTVNGVMYIKTKSCTKSASYVESQTWYNAGNSGCAGKSGQCCPN